MLGSLIISLDHGPWIPDSEGKERVENTGASVILEG